MEDKILKSSFQRARGVIGRYPQTGERYILSYSTVETRGVHMVGVRKPLKVTWVAGDEIVKEEILDPWVGHGSATADKIIEERPE